jgi:ribose transport system substrate-binding protein
MKSLLFLLWTCCVMGMPAAQPAVKDVHLVFIPKASDQVFWDLMRTGVDKAVQEDGHIQLTWRGPAHNDDTDSQIKIVQLYSKPGVDAILIAATDRVRLVESVGRAVAMGIPVVAVDSGLDGKQLSNFVTSNNYAGGQLAAKSLAELLNKKGRVSVLRTVAGSASTDDRAKGFQDYMRANAPAITVVADVHGGGSTGKARQSASALLAVQPPLDGVFSVNETATDGMLRALRDTGQAGKLRFIGFDATDALLDGLKKEEISGLVIQNPVQMGYKGIQAAAAAARGQAIKEATIFTDTVLVTKANYQNPEIQKLMCTKC